MKKDDILAKGAILQRDEETYAIAARLTAGIFDVETGRKIAKVAETFGVDMLKITGDGRLALIGIAQEDIDAAYAEMGVRARPGTALCQQYIKVCPGNTFCQRGQRDTIALAREMEKRLYPFPKISSKVKIGIAGCFNSCAEPAIKDIGLVGLPKGWVLMVGGAGGKDPMIAETVARNLSDEEVLAAVEKILKYYRGASLSPRTRNQRLGVILKKEGMGRLRGIIGVD
jgi:NAD(P)H-nitrite reductase large subunit